MSVIQSIFFAVLILALFNQVKDAMTKKESKDKAGSSDKKEEAGALAELKEMRRLLQALADNRQIPLPSPPPAPEPKLPAMRAVVDRVVALLPTRRVATAPAARIEPTLGAPLKLVEPTAYQAPIATVAMPEPVRASSFAHLSLVELDEPPTSRRIPD